MGEFLGYLFDALFALAMLRMLYAALRHFFAPRAAAREARGAATGPHSQRAGGEMVRDPECGMFVSIELSHRLNRGGEALHFCSQECLEKYRSRAA